MARRNLGVFTLAGVLLVLQPAGLVAHSALLRSDPAADVTLGDTPTAIILSFSERPEAALSTIAVRDTRGAAHHTDRPQGLADDPLSLSLPVRPLARGVYVVTWRIVSAVDGHATTGAYAFGVLMDPADVAASLPGPGSAFSVSEVLARGILLVGLVALLGASVAGVARFGGGRELMAASGGWMCAGLGLVLLAWAQRRNSDVAFGTLLYTGLGRSLVWRGLALSGAGVALLTANRPGPSVHRGSMAVVSVAAAAAIAAHVAAGHAAAGSWWQATTTIAAQWVHATAAGIWSGGLAVLLLGLVGAHSEDKAAAVRRFSTIAAGCLATVMLTGIARAVGELSSWRDLIDTGYGRVLAAKIALAIGVVTLGALNRYRSVGVAGSTLRPLRLVGSVELLCLSGVLVASAALGTLPPPISLAAAVRGLAASGVDFATTVRVGLVTTSDEPGPNRFSLTAVDYDTRQPLHPRKVTLRFLPVDDIGVATTTMTMSPQPDGSYRGSGANLTFDGRWRVTALIEQGADSTEVPMDLELRSPPRPISIQRLFGQPATYNVQLRGLGLVRLAVDPERPGPGRLFVTCFDMLGEDWPIGDIVVTTAAGLHPLRPVPVRRLDRSRFVADITVGQGRNRIAVVARTFDGNRLRAAAEIDIANR